MLAEGCGLALLFCIAVEHLLRLVVRHISAAYVYVFLHNFVSRLIVVDIDYRLSLMRVSSFGFCSKMQVFYLGARKKLLHLSLQPREFCITKTGAAAGTDIERRLGTRSLVVSHQFGVMRLWV